MGTGERAQVRQAFVGGVGTAALAPSRCPACRGTEKAST